MTTGKKRARISDGRLGEHLDGIARQVLIVREAQAIMTTLDPGTLAFNIRRFQRIIEAADETRLELIDRMDAEKQAAKDGRENGIDGS